MSKAIPYFFPIGVRPGDIDFMGHVNNAHYLTWVQEAVIAHWRNLAPPEAVAGHLWVALKHEITYRRPTFLGDDVIATVLLEKFHGARAFYQTVIRRGEGFKVVCHQRRYWMEAPRGFYQPIHWMARLDAEQASAPRRFAWGFRTSLSEKAASQGNGSVPVHLLDDLASYSFDNLSQGRRYHLRKSRKRADPVWGNAFQGAV